MALIDISRVFALLLLLVVSSCAERTLLKGKGGGKDCAKGCTDHGNCNRDLGRCECQLGYTGPTCQDFSLGACRTSDQPDAHVRVGVATPKNCYCYEQWRDLLCRNVTNKVDRLNEEVCVSHITMVGWGDVHCFRKTGAPLAQQVSVVPNISDAAYEWGHGEWRPEPGSNRRFRAIAPMATPLSEVGTSPDDKRALVPLHECPDHCHYNGWCQGTPGTGKYFCRCYMGWSGATCEKAEDDSCLFGCGGRGECKSGWCHCDPGYWGVACARSTGHDQPDKAAQRVPTPTHRLRVYMYDLPPDVAHVVEHDDGSNGIFHIYHTFLTFLRMFLNDWAVRTENPWEANMFFLPVLAYYYTGNLGDASQQILRGVEYARTVFPFYDRYQGRDHFVVLTQDRGACYLDDAPLLRNVIKVTHFGLNQPNITWMKNVKDMKHGCHNPVRDVVFPPIQPDKDARQTHLTFLPYLRNETSHREPVRKVLFFFAGGIRENEPDYSGGVRQALHKILSQNDYPDVAFSDNVKSYGTYSDSLRKSRFCLAVYGHGWGIRLSQAIYHGCIPVIIQDGVYQAFEDLLPYRDFSVRVSKADLPRLIHILRAMPAEEEARLRRGLAAHHLAFVWQPDVGGLAYNYTLASLHKRLSNLRGGLY
uniref:EGF-like domain-containing protein n=1 Tax=Chlamydomonas leiostraca TaxID=1034604 RepID=A0A7S0RCE8_9CHLO|mmetsp:Transcript_18698/g.47367  ORF Transcript_18698/g.47367 Transcript_18698/m.47367 type:complete len:645 (+) Transcript_18698:98-2032(+)